MPGNYRANFWFLMTENDGGGGGSYNSMDGNGFFWAMDNAGLTARLTPTPGRSRTSGATAGGAPHGGYDGSAVGGNMDECMGNWMMLQFLNTYPQAARLHSERHVHPDPRAGLLRLLADL